MVTRWKLHFCGDRESENQARNASNRGVEIADSQKMIPDRIQENTGDRVDSHTANSHIPVDSFGTGTRMNVYCERSMAAAVRTDVVENPSMEAAFGRAGRVAVVKVGVSIS